MDKIKNRAKIMMKCLEQEKRDKLLEISEITRISNPILCIYVKEITPELQEKVKAVMGDINYNILLDKTS